MYKFFTGIVFEEDLVVHAKVSLASDFNEVNRQLTTNEMLLMDSILLLARFKVPRIKSNLYPRCITFHETPKNLKLRKRRFTIEAFVSSHEVSNAHWNGTLGFD